MKKHYLYAMSLALVSMLGACSNDDEPNDNGGTGEPDETAYADVAYILNQGNMGQKVEGRLSVLDENRQELSSGVFQAVNKRSLGDTPQCGIAYGSKIYVGVYVSNTIEIIDRNTYKSIKQISLENSDKGTQPRSMVAKNGKVYVSMYDGYVARLDTLSMELDASVKVGPNPENIEIFNNRIYVPNSDGMNYKVGYGETASVVTLEPFAVEETIKVPLNPNKFMTDGTNLFLLSMGNYGDVDAEVYKMVEKVNDKGEKEIGFNSIAKATLAAVGAGKIYMVNAPYGGTVSYSRYDIASGTTREMKCDEVSYPSGIGVDAENGTLLISAMPLDGGYASYVLPGTLCEYDLNGLYRKTYNIGSGPAVIFF